MLFFFASRKLTKAAMEDGKNEPFEFFVFPNSPARDVPFASPSSLAGVWLGFAREQFFSTQKMVKSP